KAVSNFATM
nr:Chain C, Pre-glycoprotein polyprotein GP complex [Lymphocytic choriomeningitis virus (strain WE)]3QUL_F Chain F, Pre-glycoprotein polyprotein GP complex [Lymphocytic choriomeningitis virus (strain WE)]3QUL_I Chain I, Pre-glycoprotein polyprotein GP complex [Lymphocytic choriomeningitis virus (strain WE)]3QUL_L Chain L, Pre-glycoprotein polyprotein GP complex [Lymphocytic choriomeningitis virus (strain WE)]